MLFKHVCRSVYALIIILSVLCDGKIAHADTGIGVVDMRTVVRAVDSARTITVTAYTLRKHSSLALAMARAGDRGARVILTLDSKAFGPVVEVNAETTEFLQSYHHVSVLQSHGPLHAKVALIDRQLFLSDRNWDDNGGGIVVTDSNEDDRNAVALSLRGGVGSNRHFWMRKADALAAEANVLLQPSANQVQFETESFGPNTPVFEALMQRSRSGAQVRIIVASLEYNQRNRSASGRPSSEHRALAELAASGAEIRVGTSNEKIALVGNAVWFGSSNATKGLPDQSDWGMALLDGVLANQIRARFERNWIAALPVSSQ